MRGCSDLEAAQEAEHLREFCFLERCSFTFETVLSTERNIDLLSRAKDAGSHVEGITEAISMTLKYPYFVFVAFIA